GRPERAELMRLQCDPARRGEPSARERELIEKNRAAWLGPLQPFVESARFERGLMLVTVSMRTFLSKAFQSAATHALRSARAAGMELWGNPKHWSRVGPSAVFASVHHLRLTGRAIGRLAVPALAGSTHLAALHTLDLDDTYLSEANLSALLDPARLPRLRSL